MAASSTNAELERSAASAPTGGPLLDPDLPDFVGRGDMPARLAAACVKQGQVPPVGRAEFVRCIFESLACKTRAVLESLEEASDVRAETIHIVGGGARNETLCRLIADISGRPVKVGPIEATGLGNVLVQLEAQGYVTGLTEMRELAKTSFHDRQIDPAADRSLGRNSTHDLLRSRVPRRSPSSSPHERPSGG